MAEVSLKAQVSNLLTEYSNLVRNYFAATEALAEGRLPPVLPAGGGPVHPDAIMQRIVDIDAKLQKAVDQSVCLLFSCGKTLSFCTSLSNFVLIDTLSTHHQSRTTRLFSARFLKSRKTSAATTPVSSP